MCNCVSVIENYFNSAELSSVEAEQNRVIGEALLILARRIQHRADILSAPADVREYLQLALVEREQEVFCCLYLDNKHRVIEFKEMFYGTVDSCSVYPREVVKYALHINAVAVILAHNHPSGISEPSAADRLITAKLKEALKMVDVRVLDHFIVSSEKTLSLAEQGLL